MRTNSLALSLFAVILICAGCSEFIEESLEDKKILLLAPVDRYESSNYNMSLWWERMEGAQGTPLNSQEGGPTMRYVRNPHDGKVIDMRHMLMVGNLPPAVASLIEVGQWLKGLASGMNKQDFYSNSVGYQFYM